MKEPPRFNFSPPTAKEKDPGKLISLRFPEDRELPRFDLSPSTTDEEYPGRFKL
jgi:hypothetical protein